MVKVKPRILKMLDKKGNLSYLISKNSDYKPAIIKLSNTKLSRKQLSIIIFKLGLHISVPELRILLENAEIDSRNCS